jgi:anti-anti-sigma regulatory factor/anti-sigma regulatory factor (Ser/Thr protein kinase)
MPSQLMCHPEQDLPIGVLTVTGILDLVTADALEQAVRRSLSVEPRVLLIDIAGLEIADPLALDALGDVACQTAEWPAVPIVLCGPGAETARVVAAWPDCGAVEVADSCEQAFADADAVPEPPRIRARLRPVPDACRQVRQLVAHACATWQRGELTATATLVATELVANVVRHAHTTMDFTVGLRDGRVSLAVRDGSRRLPRPADAKLTDSGGRGLRLVRELTDSWGVLPFPDGKVVWTRIGTGTSP